MSLMRFVSGLLTAVILFTSCGSPNAAEDTDIFPYRWENHDLANGLRAVLVDSGYPNLVGLYVVVQTGSRNEVEPGKSGFAHLFEHMMFRGTEKYPPEAWEQIMQAAGAETNAYTSDDRTVYHAVFAAEDLEQILELEADRFQNLEYSEEIFRTETRAVLSEYNKSFANPFRKLEEQFRKTAFDTHTYRHTTIGFEEDIEAMPELYEYGLQFFDRYYRPEYTTIAVVGDFDFERTLGWIEKYWGVWEKGGFETDVPAEPQQQGPRSARVDFHAPTLPIVQVSFKAPGYDDEVVDSAALDLISFYAFGESSELYKRLVIDEQLVDLLAPQYYDHLDPYPFSVVARVKDSGDIDAVQRAILATFEALKEKPIPPERLEAIKSHLRYDFALGMNSTAAIADTLAHYLGLRRTPETINKRYRLYASVTAEDILATANEYFVENGRTITKLQYTADEESGE